jgi:glycosyltransferase involved in cell wall biosynthesis/O-antigen/teichoic acid export membrane protein
MGRDRGGRETIPRNVLLGATALAVVGPVAGLGNFAFHALASRALGPDGYGALVALLAITVVVAVPAAAVQMTLARSLLSGAVSAGHLLRPVWWSATVIGALTVIAAPVVADVLALQTPAPVLALAGYLVAVIVGLVPKAVLISQERLGTFAAGSVAGVAVRLGLGAVWLGAGGDLTAAIAAGSIGEVLATAALLWATRREYRTGGKHRTSTRPSAGSAGGWRVHVGPVLGFGGLWAMLSVDTVASRVLMEGTDAGTYAAAAVLGRGVLLLPQSVATAAFARLAHPVARPRVLPWATAVALVMSVAGVCGLALFGPSATRLLFGASFAVDQQLLTVLGASAAVMAVVNVWVHARLAYGQPVGLRMLGALGLCATGVLPAAALGSHALAWWMVAVSLVALWLLRPGSAVPVPFPDPAALPPPVEVDVTIVLPVRNAAGAVGRHLVAVEAALAESASSYEVIVVDDGSTDATAAVAGASAGPPTRVVSTAHRGKGGALSTGMAQARGALVGFIDGDGDIDAGVLSALIAAASAEGVDGAVAVKGDVASRGLYRRAASLGYRLVVRVTLSVGVSDTQTGAKVYRRDTVVAVLPWLSERGFAWDAEFLAAAWRLGYRTFAEVPVPVARSHSRIRLRTAWSMLRATVRVASRVAMLPGPSPRAGAHPGSHPVPAGAGDSPNLAVPVTLRARPPYPLRVLVLNWKCHRHPAAGGAEIYTHEVARRWAAGGHTVTVLTPAVPGAPGYEDVDGYRVERRGGRYSVYRHAREFYHARRGEFDVILDCVNTRPFEAPVWAEVAVVALFFQLARDVWFYEMPAPLAAAGRFVLEPAWIKAYRDVPVATISESSAASLRRAGLGRVVTVGVGASIPDEIPAGVRGPVPSVAFVGRMVRTKRPFDALAAFASARERLGQGRLVLMGDGPIAPQVRAAAGRVSGATFLGRVSEREKFARLARAHVLVATSVREGWGMVVDEAAAVGAYPIGYRVPGLVDAVPAAGGTLVAPTPAALADALVDHLPRLVAEPARPRRGGALTWDEVAARLLAVMATATRPMERV